MSNNNEKLYWNKIVLLNKFFEKKLLENRKKIYKIFESVVKLNQNESLLDVGTAPTIDVNHNLILQKLKNNKHISCLSDVDCNILKEVYPNVKEFLIGTGINIKLNSNTYDVVYSSATIEHVGSFENQLLFVSECFRLSKRAVFITTPNRYFPLDFHTKIPLIHYLPKKVHRFILRLFGLNFYSKESNLNLLSISDLIYICNKLEIKNYKIVRYKLFNITSNLILYIWK